MKKILLPNTDKALPGRDAKMMVDPIHAVNGNPIQAPFPEEMEQAVFGLGCFWGAERCFWRLCGVFSTAVGYSAGVTTNPTYEEVCSGATGHNEVVLVIFDPNKISYKELLKVFFESHDPTQYMRQGNDRGTQYRSGIYTFNDSQVEQAEERLKAYERDLMSAGYSEVQTELVDATEFYYAETYHQQYLHKNPNGYCGLGGTGINCT